MRALIGLFAATSILALANIDRPTLDQDGYPKPNLGGPYNYANPDLPAHYLTAEVKAADNTPDDNPVTDAGATLGRVLFYDKRLSGNFTKSCASCHIQKHNFAEPNRDSEGFEGLRTGLNAMSLTNARYFPSGHVFWTERDTSLERQAIRPVLDPVELGTFDIPTLIKKLNATSFYPGLFKKAFGTSEINQDRIVRAITQFERSLISYQSKYDQALSATRMEDVLTAEELRGFAIFGGLPIEVKERAGLSDVKTMGCNDCHSTAAMFLSDSPTSNGINRRGRFKVPSLRNVEVSGPFMHDGRFLSLGEVVDHYINNVSDSPSTDKRLRINDDPTQPVERHDLSQADRAALLAFLKTLTDQKFLTDPKFSDPFNWPDK